MNTGRLSVNCFVLFLVGVVGGNVALTEGGSTTLGIAGGALAVVTFVYAMYLWKYRLEVTGPGHGPYKTTLYICAHLGHNDTIPVRISRWNRWRVTFDPDARGSDGPLGGRAGREQAIEEALAERGNS